MFLRLSQVFQNMPEDERMLFHSVCFIHGGFCAGIMSLRPSSLCQGTHKTRGSYHVPAQPLWMYSGWEWEWERGEKTGV